MNDDRRDPDADQESPRTDQEHLAPSEGRDPWCTWCHGPLDDGPIYRIHGEDWRWPPAFCSLECAARWGNAAHQDRIYRVEDSDAE